MAAQKCKKKFPNKFLAFLNVYYPKTHLIKVLNSLDSSWPKTRLSQNPKTGGIRVLVSAWKWFQNLLHSKLSRKHPQPKTWNSDLSFFFNLPFYIWTQYTVKPACTTTSIKQPLV